MAPTSSDRSLGRGARARILNAAQILFGLQGYNATSINDLRAQARVSKRTLYQQFESKDALILAHLEQSAAKDPAAAVLAREQLAPRTRLLELFTTLAERPLPPAPEPFLAAATEFPDPRHPVHQAAAAHAAGFRERLAELARAAGARDPDRIGRRLALLYDGAAAATLLDDPAEVVSIAYTLAATILRDAID